MKRGVTYQGMLVAGMLGLAIIVLAVLTTIGFMQIDRVQTQIAQQDKVRQEHSSLICPAINRLNREYHFALLPCETIVQQDKP